MSAGPLGRAPRQTWAMIAGGGTAGHVNPALAVASALVANGHPATGIHFVGARRGMEATLVPQAGFEVTLLPGRGIKRQLSRENVGAVAGLVGACFRASLLMGSLRPKVLVSVGGYASFPAAIAAVLWQVPIVVVEPDAHAGLANRLTARVAKASAVPFPGTPLPRSVVTGNPIRLSMQRLDRSNGGRRSARRELGLPEEGVVVAVSGGSLGSLRINEAVVGLAHLWRERKGFAVYHVVGRRDEEQMRRLAPRISSGGLVYKQVGYEDRMDLVFSAADLAVVRAGASLFELAAAGLPSVLVPLPNAPGDHQARNAARMREAGASVVIRDEELTSESLARTLDEVLEDPATVKKMEDGALSLAKPDAASAIARLVERFARD